MADKKIEIEEGYDEETYQEFKRIFEAIYPLIANNEKVLKKLIEDHKKELLDRVSLNQESGRWWKHVSTEDMIKRQAFFERYYKERYKKNP